MSVLHAEIDLITADPLRLGDSMKYIEDTVRPVVESQRGSLGMSLHADTELGIAVLETFWASRVALRSGEDVTAASRDEAVRRATGTVTVEHYSVPVFERAGPVAAGAGVRLTRMDLAPSRVEDAVEIFGDTAVPWLAEGEGCRRVLYLVDRDSGRAISETVWRDAQALARSRSAAAAVRAEAIVSAGCVIRAVEEYTLVFSSARKA
jgi:quinol monooxygenase YgiN